MTPGFTEKYCDKNNIINDKNAETKFNTIMSKF